ncbi:MAG TPA: iron ABC transporter permease [Clostridiaceae bacterium]|nr:iron ABC transporter permease [Clostridiaceae bacterium]
MSTSIKRKVPNRKRKIHRNNTEKLTKLTEKIEIYYKLASVIPMMLFMLLLIIIFSTAIGSVNVPFKDTVKIILKNWGLIKNITFTEGWESIIFYVRFPRVITTILVGAALGTSGAVMQGMFRNPMADPGILGVSSGAGFGAVVAIYLGIHAKSIYFMPLFASAGALVAAFVVFLLSIKNGKIPVMNMILSGMAVSTFLSAITTAILSFARSDQVKQFLFWTVGSLNGTRWEDVKISVIPIIVCTVILLFFSKDLNILLLGEEEAQSVGLNPAKTRKLILLLSSILTATAVSVSGTISFVGLIVPHIIRLLIGPDHRLLIPASALGGSIFLLLCDLIGRTIVAPGELSVGIVTSIIGAPYFLILLNRARKEGVAL